MGPGRPIHDGFFGDDGADGHSAGESLGEAHDVGDDSDVLTSEHLAGPPHPRLDFVAYEEDAVFVAQFAEILEEVERGLVERALISCRGNRSQAARKLGLSRRGLLNKIERFGLSDVGLRRPRTTGDLETNI